MKKLLAICLILALLVLPVSATKESFLEMAQATAAALERLAGAEAGELLEEDSWTAGVAVCDWAALGFARLGLAEDYRAYADKLNIYVSEQYAKRGCLDATRATEAHRAALTAMALGLDPTAMGIDGSIDLIRDGTYGFPDGAGKQGVNGWIFALICIRAQDFDLPEDYEDQLVDEILDAQQDCGAFGLTADTPDPDVTAMALQALQCRKQDALVIEAANRAFDWLSSQQATDGTFLGYGQEVSCETAAQVLLALCAWDCEPDDSRFVKNGVTLLDVLVRFRLADSSYCHTLGESVGDRMATGQVLLAQTALYLRQTGQGWLYDFHNYQPPESTSAGVPIAAYVAIGCGAVLFPAAALLLVKKAKKRKGEIGNV